MIKGIIFDLDDTLYSEKQYVRSGFRAVADFLKRPDDVSYLWRFFEEGKPAIDAYLRMIGMEGKKEESVYVYREHIPDISLYDTVEEKLLKLKNEGMKLGIITDGRPNGQRNKIAALGVDRLVDDIIITDELGGEQFRKPCDIAFRIMQRRWEIPFEQMMYVGDNINKDFEAPKQLGMQYFWFQNPDGIYNVNDKNIGGK